jgi:cellulose synthase/poly-beta-1,6-N-acetylglucosamine synthase-like glycosyltransferase
MNEPADLPFVSILIAARNEEATILDCLRAIHALNYPPNRLEILVGDDASTDRTATLIRSFIQDKPAYELVSISPKYPQLNGKANVLAQLAHLAQGSFLFTTDADARVSPDWVRAMLRQFDSRPDERVIGVVNGVSTIRGRSVWAQVQAVECLLVFRAMSLAADWQIPITGVGNNMAFRREAYDAVGGFENQPFSVVEDYTIFQAIVGKGYGFGQAFNRETLVEMLPVPNVEAYLQQRKRWMQGVFDLPIRFRLAPLLQYLLGPLLLILAIWFPGLALPLYAAKVLGQTLLLGNALIQLRQTHLWVSALIYEPYQLLFGLLAFGYYWLPTGVVWKERKYSEQRSVSSDQ